MQILKGIEVVTMMMFSGKTQAIDYIVLMFRIRRRPFRLISAQKNCQSSLFNEQFRALCKCAKKGHLKPTDSECSEWMTIQSRVWK